jgi:hypothetical protein
MKKDKMVWGALLHLGSNMWDDFLDDPDGWAKSPEEEQQRPNPMGPSDKKKRSRYRSYMRCNDAIWKGNVDHCAAEGLNTVFIDLGEGVFYPSHPELAVKGTWSVEKLRKELARIRALGLEPVPKLNFSACHDSWLKEYHRMLSTEKYYQVVADVIKDVVEMFDHPRFFHIGYDEETMGHQGGWGRYEYIVVRRGALYWRDFLRCVDTVRSTGCRPWCFSDQIWQDHDRFIKYMPRDVIMCPWHIRPEKPKTQMIEELAALGFDFIPDGSTHTTREEGIERDELVRTLDYCGKVIPKKHLLGYVICPWVTCTPGVPKRKYIESMQYAEEQFKLRGL